jgi:hypothetical protein
VPSGTGAPLQDAWRFVDLSSPILLRAGVLYEVGGQNVADDGMTDSGFGNYAIVDLNATFTEDSARYGGTWPGMPSNDGGQDPLRWAPGNAEFTPLTDPLVDVTADSANRIIGSLANTHYDTPFATTNSGPQKTLVQTTNATLLAALGAALGPGPYTIDSAILTVGDPADSYNPTDATAHVVLVPWDPTDVTWNEADADLDIGWGTPGLLAGTDYDATVAANGVVQGTTTVFDLTAVVQGWLDGSIPNYGLLFPTTTSGGSPETLPSYVVWTIQASIPEPASAVLLGLAGLLALRRRRG